MQCVKAPEAHTARTRAAAPAAVDCGENGGVITSIEFASFGTPAGVCGAFTPDAACDAPGARAAVEAACLGKSSCTLVADSAAYGPLAAGACGAARSLYVQARCSGAHSVSARTLVPTGAAAALSLPAAPALVGGANATAGGVTVTESGVVVFAGGVAAAQFPAGVLHAAWDAARGAVVVTVGAGAYAFELARV